jgi:hypothetical protein
MAEQRLMLDDGSLVDLLDRLVDTGVVVDGNVLIALAGVDLIRLDLRALVAALATLTDEPVPAPAPRAHRTAMPPRPAPRDSVSHDPAESVPTNGFRGRSRTEHDAPDRRSDDVATAGGRAGSDPGDVVGRLGRQLGQAQNQSGLAGLVVVVVDLVRQLLQRQALRRMDAGSLTDDEVERLGRALMSLQQQVADLVEALDLHPHAGDDRR